MLGTIESQPRLFDYVKRLYVLFKLKENFDIFIFYGNQLDSFKKISSNQTFCGLWFQHKFHFPSLCSHVQRGSLCNDSVTTVGSWWLPHLCSFSGLWWAVQDQIPTWTNASNPRHSQATIATPSLSFPSLPSLEHLLAP